jgi:hypothetical protein
MRRIFDFVGDIDFCEYFPVTDTNGFDTIASNMDGTERVACIKLALGDKQWHYPWGNDKPTSEFFASIIDSTHEDTSTIMVKYVGDVDFLGVTEITNLIIAVNEYGASAGLTKTFAAQEAPLVPIEWLPNQMNDPIEMGRYINWLTNTIMALCKQGNMRKCLKRCASLSRVLFCPEITEEIADLAGRSPVLLSQKVKELEALFAMLNRFGDDRSVRLSALIRSQSQELVATLSEAGGTPDKLAFKRFDDEADSIVRRLINHVRPGDDDYPRRAA